MLHYTGHPFIDIGIAAITAHVRKRRPEELTTDDLTHVAAYIEQQYIKSPLRGHLTMAFTSNAWFIQDAFNPDRPELSAEKSAERRATRDRWAANHLRQWEGDATSGEMCVFTGLPAAPRELSGKLAAGRIGRNQMPLLQGDDAINFFSGGDPGLPISPQALLALQFMPMGCAKCGVGLLAVHADDGDLTREFARTFLEKNVQAVTLAQAAGEDKLPSAHRSLKTLLIEQLTDIEQQRTDKERRTKRAASITAYNFNNGKEPKLVIYELPLQITNFLRTVITPTYKEAWQQLVQSSWRRVQTKSNRKKTAIDTQSPSYNYLYEDLFKPPEQAPQFIRRHFLRVSQPEFISWPLVDLYLREVMQMDASKIELIKQFAERLTDYIEQTQGARFFRSFRVIRNYNQFHTLLTSTLYRAAARQNILLFDIDQFVAMFEDEEEAMPGGWQLIRNLIVIRIIEQLYHRRHLQDFTEALEEEQEVETE
jgi:CRISPR-associated protein Cst1